MRPAQAPMAGPCRTAPPHFPQPDARRFGQPAALLALAMSALLAGSPVFAQSAPDAPPTAAEPAAGQASEASPETSPELAPQPAIEPADAASEAPASETPGAAPAETVVAPPSVADSIGMPALTPPGSGEAEVAPPVAATDSAPVLSGPSPVLAGPEGAAGSGGAAPAPGTDPATDPAADPAGGTAAEPEAGAAPAPEDGLADHGLPHDLSPRGMYEAADWVVKSVMIGLAAASLLTWTVFVVKVVELWFAGRRARRAIGVIQRAGTLQDARDAIRRKGGPAAFMIRSGAEEYGRSYPAVAEAGPEGIKERVTSILSRIEAQAARRMQRGTGLLASIGSVAPFVGLFGTVWGIMNSFIGIAESQTTNLAIVAPGIAEALLATAIGLVAAIPAVIFYNGFARAIAGYRLKLVDAAAGIERLVSRDLDFRVEPRAAPGRKG